MNLSCGAVRLLSHLRFLSSLEKGAIKFQRTLALRFRVCSRTIRRWLTELKEGGFLASIIRRGRTSARYEMSTQAAENVHSKAAPPIFTERREEKEQREAPRRGPQMETGLEFFRSMRNLARFEEFIGIFIAAGRPLNAGDVGAARVTWALLSAEDKAQAIAAIEKQLRATESAAFMPLPANFLRAKPWTRTAPPRTLPYDKPSKTMDRLQQAWEILKRRGVA